MAWEVSKSLYEPCGGYIWMSREGWMVHFMECCYNGGYKEFQLERQQCPQPESGGYSALVRPDGAESERLIANKHI